VDFSTKRTKRYICHKGPMCEMKRPERKEGDTRERKERKTGGKRGKERIG